MDFSVLIPLCDRPELVSACLESLARTVKSRWRYEVILVEGTDGVTTPRSDSRCRVIRHEGPPGRAAFLNAATRAARAPVFCFADPGTTFMPGWLEPMWHLLRREESVGCIGNIQREPYSGLIEGAGILFDLDGMPVPAHSGEPLPPRPSYARRPAVSAACCLVSRVVFVELDGFDERFRHHFEDVDFCLRATETGRRHFVAHRSIVYHLSAPAPDAADVEFYRVRWGERARAHHRANSARRGANGFSLERWLAAWEARRQYRQDLLDGRKDGRRYLKKHLVKPWRYNYRRFSAALVQSTHPLPPSIPRPPTYVPDDDALDAFDPAVNGRDAVLFAAPRR